MARASCSTSCEYTQRLDYLPAKPSHTCIQHCWVQSCNALHAKSTHPCTRASMGGGAVSSACIPTGLQEYIDDANAVLEREQRFESKEVVVRMEYKWV